MRRPASTPPDLPGYRHVRLLGSGGFSDVFLYEQQLPKRRVAVKVLLLDELTPATRAAFVAEANLMAQLSAHPYIVTIYHADVAADDRPYFVMEYCSGPSLAERYKQAPLAVADALRTGVRLSSAVQTAHQAGILHRDIKPANVLGNDYGWPALSDFGISSAVDDSVTSHTTTVSRELDESSTSGTSGQVGLSVPWSPPEMFDDDPDPDVRSDVFSLAATMWTVLAGRTPFEVPGRGNGTLDLIGRIERGAITPMDRTDLPRSLIAVLQKGMASARGDRFASALEFGRALQRVEMELGYARTELEVPHLHLDAPDRGPGGGDDETRVRQVAVIDAQSPAPAPADETQVRSPATVVAQQSAPASPLPTDTVVRSRPTRSTAPDPAEAEPTPEADVAEQPAAPRSRRGLLRGLIVGGGAVVVVAAVVVGLVLSGGAAGEQDPDPVVTSTGESALPSRILAPELAAPPTLEGSTVTFALSNPEPQGDDRLVWRLAGRPDQPTLRPVEGDVLRVDGYTAGAPLCVEVMVLRNGKTSEPLAACYPPAP